MTLLDILEKKHISARRNLFHLRDLKGGLFYIFVENPVSENAIWNYFSDSVDGCLVYLKNEKKISKVEMFLPITDIKYDHGQNVTGDVLFKLKKVSPFTIQETPTLFGNASSYNLIDAKRTSKWEKISFNITQTKYLMRKGSIKY